MVNKEAEAKKQEGLEFFKGGKYDDAIASFTAAIELDGTNGVYPSNRAFCHIKKKDWDSAEKDCDESIKLDGASKIAAKAFDRRGQARIQLKKYKEAVEDFENAKKLDPKTKNVDKNIEEAEKKMAEDDDKEKEAAEAEKKEEAKKNEEDEAKKKEEVAKKKEEEDKQKEEEDKQKEEEARKKEEDKKDEEGEAEKKEEESGEDNKKEEEKSTEEKSSEQIKREIEEMQLELERKLKEKEQALQDKIEREREEELRNNIEYRQAELDRREDEARRREQAELTREEEFAKIVEMERNLLLKEKERMEEERRRFEQEREEFEEERTRSNSKYDSGIGSRNDTAEPLYKDPYQEDEEHSTRRRYRSPDSRHRSPDSRHTSRSRRSSSEEPPRSPYPRHRSPEPEEVQPVRKSKWRPEVGKAPPPNLENVRSRVESKNRDYKPKSARRVEIFNDSEYMHKMKAVHGKRDKRGGALLSTHPPSGRQSRANGSADEERPRSLVMQRVDDDQTDAYRSKSYDGRYGRKSGSRSSDDRLPPDPPHQGHVTTYAGGSTKKKKPRPGTYKKGGPEDELKELQKEKIRLQMERAKFEDMKKKYDRDHEEKKKESDPLDDIKPLNIDPFDDEEYYKPKKSDSKKHSDDLKNEWDENFNKKHSKSRSHRSHNY